MFVITPLVPSSPELYIKKANEQFLSADFRQGIDTLSAGILAFAKSPELYFDLGKRLYVESQRTKSAEILDQALTAVQAAYAISPRYEYALVTIEYLIAAGKAESAQANVVRLQNSISQWVTEGRLIRNADAKVRELHNKLFLEELEKSCRAEVQGDKLAAVNHRFHAVTISFGEWEAGPGRHEHPVTWELVGAEDSARMEEELAEANKRSHIGDSSIPPLQPAADSPLVQVEVTRLRKATREAYEKAYTLKQAEGRPERVCHALALSSALYSRLLAFPDAPSICDEVTEVILMECTPFKDLTPQEGMTAIVEYVVWREYPNLAKEDLISGAVRSMKATLTPDVVQSLKAAPFPWIRFL